jgi:hypothetical protein
MRNFLLELLNLFEYLEVPMSDMINRENTKTLLAKHPYLL